MSFRLPLCAIGLLLLLSSCKDRQITSYRAPKDSVVTPSGAPGAAMAGNANLPADHPPIDGAPTAGSSMASTAVPTGSDSLTWAAPASWTAMPDRPMRKATFAVKGDSGATGDLSITSFPGDTGGLLANLNRWRGQIGLAPLTEDKVAASLEHLESHGVPMDVADFAGTANGAPTRLLGAIVPYKGDTWFFKLTGPDTLVAKEKPAFLDFLRTISPR